jgi:tetratricopeptide (TPR) repeat protein
MNRLFSLAIRVPRTTTKLRNCYSYSLDHQQINKIRSLLSKGRYSAVIDLCEHQIEKDMEEDITECLDAIYFRAYALHKMGQTGEALNDIEYLVFVHDPKNVPGMLLKANVLKAINQIDEAHDLYEKVLSRDPDNCQALTTLARYYLSKPEYIETPKAIKNRPEIVTTFEKVLKINRDLPLEEHLTKGMVAQVLNRHEEALSHFEKVLEIDPENTQGKVYSAICHTLINNDVEKNKTALATLNEILKTDPNNKTCLYYKALAMKNLNKLKDAEEALKRLLVIAPHSYEALNQLGQIYALERQHFDAIDCFDKALTINSNDSSSLRLKGVSLYHVGIYDEALDCFERAIANEPTSNGLLLGKLHVLVAMSKWDEVIETCDIILMSDPNNNTANFYRLQAMTALKK